MTAGSAYLGHESALAFRRIWVEPTHVLRRVDTIELVDRAVFNHRVTVDFDGRELASIWGKGKRSHILPLMTLVRSEFFDVDLKSVDGSVVHLSRRRNNVLVTAHIVIGMCMAAGLPPSREVAAFQSVVAALSTFESRTAREGLAAHVEGALGEYRVNEEGEVFNEELADFLEELETEHIQCIEIGKAFFQGHHIVKLRIALLRKSINDLTPVISADSVISNTEDLAECDSGTFDFYPSDAENRHSGAAQPRSPIAFLSEIRIFLTEKAKLFSKRWGLSEKWNQFRQSWALSPTRIEVNLGALGRQREPTHIRVLAPAGIKIADVQVSDGKGSPVSPSSEFFRKFHHERVVLLDRGLLKAKYMALVSLNPKRGVFLIPAMIALLCMAAVLAVGLLVTDKEWLANDAALTAALFLVPSFAAVFIARDSEHELMSRILGVSRLLFIVCCGLTILAGAFMATLNSRVEPWNK